MTTGEILVIAASAAVFVIINIIMWTMISKKERKIRERTTPPHDINEKLSDGVMEAAAVEGFKLIENTVIVHTNERIIS
ncbi:hypothetical protein [Ruminococcus flavefaciens]|uniref:Uncharacterized protein n=1 Tax=Ruminococcus flavefaciens TaxID=1265 RepID=A0A1M7GI46_RUMFL|nr:hypothetical protein [Ruminococcus flavefaciens]SHM15866.1 hypothetical protein SAMN04487860_101314 [Ruminococcus flavefaciens]